MKILLEDKIHFSIANVMYKFSTELLFFLNFFKVQFIHLKPRN